MKKFYSILLGCLIVSSLVNAQSKVFKEVGEGISSQLKVIVQDDVLMGYLSFTQLEKVNEDTFNYKISIMDENLNDIGTVNFREQSLELQAVSFEQDILCLAYLKSNMPLKRFGSTRKYVKAFDNAEHNIFTQFINLDGKIIKTNSFKANLKIDQTRIYSYVSKLTGVSGDLKHNIQLKNLPQKGFACFYGDETKNQVRTFDLKGEPVWNKDVPDALDYALLTSGEHIYILSKKEHKMKEGGFELSSLAINDGKAFDRIPLNDKKGNELRILSFANDPATGKPVITGNIINEKRGNKFTSAKQQIRGLYDGVFTMTVNGPKKKDVVGSFSYWNDGSNASLVSEKALYAQTQSYCRFSESFRDFNGNTYFVGSSMIKRKQWGTISAAVILSPLFFVSPYLLATTGTNKFRVDDALIVKQDAKGNLSLASVIDADKSKFIVGKGYYSYLDTKRFYNVTNNATKSNFLIVDDLKNIYIYNVEQAKLVRTVPHKDKNVRTNIFPAKEGSILVTEYDQKEKTTRMSIEAL